MTKVAVIVPCYNQAPYIVEALESVRSQTYSDWLCVIVNDASTDNSDAVIREYVAGIRDERFRYFSLPQNKGVAYARNFAISHSESEYILPLDGDDKIDNQYLEKSVDLLSSNTQITIVYTDAKHFGEDESICIMPEIILQKMCHQNPLHATALFRRMTFLSTDGYRENMVWGYEDWDLWLQMIDKPASVKKIPEILFYARQKNQSRNQGLLNSNKLEIAMRHQLKINNQTFFEKYDSNKKEKDAMVLRIFRKIKRVRFRQ